MQRTKHILRGIYIERAEWHRPASEMAGNCWHHATRKSAKPQMLCQVELIFVQIPIYSLRQCSLTTCIDNALHQSIGWNVNFPSEGLSLKLCSPQSCPANECITHVLHWEKERVEPILILNNWLAATGNTLCEVNPIGKWIYQAGIEGIFQALPWRPQCNGNVVTVQ